MVQAQPPDALTAYQLGAVQKALSLLSSPEDDTWQAALALVQQLAQQADAAQHLQQVCAVTSHAFGSSTSQLMTFSVPLLL